MHPEKQSILKYSFVLIHIVLQVSFSHWSTDLAPFKNYNAKKIQHAYNMFIQHADITCITHSNTSRSCSKNLTEKPAV